MKYIYMDNFAVIVNEEQESKLGEHFTQNKPNDPTKMVTIGVQQALKMLEEAKEATKPVIKKVVKKKVAKKIVKKEE